MAIARRAAKRIAKPLFVGSNRRLHLLSFVPIIQSYNVRQKSGDLQIGGTEVKTPVIAFRRSSMTSLRDGPAAESVERLNHTYCVATFPHFDKRRAVLFPILIRRRKEAEWRLESD